VIAHRLLNYTLAEQAFFFTFNENNPSLPVESRLSWSFDTSDFKHCYTSAETNLRNDETQYSDRSANSETYFQGSDTNAEENERDSEEEGIGQDISSDSNSYEPAPQHSDVVSPSAPQRLLRNFKGVSDFQQGGDTATVKQILQEKSAFEDFEAARRCYSSVFNASKLNNQGPNVVPHSNPRRLLHNSKGVSEFALGTAKPSVSQGFHDKSAFERFERANRGTSSGSKTSEHVLHSSEVMSSFLPVGNTSDVLLADNKLTVEAKAAQSDIHDASSALKPNDSRTLKNTEVLLVNDSRPKAASSSSQGAPQRSSRPTAPQDVATPSPRSPTGQLALENGAPTSLPQGFKSKMLSLGYSNPTTQLPSCAASPSTARRVLQSGSASPVVSMKQLGKLPSRSRGGSPLLFGSPQAKTAPSFGAKPASSSKMVSSAIKPTPTTSPIPPVAELLKIQRQLRRVPPRATQRQTMASAATLADDGRRRVRPAD
jgi:hypothetical protein